MFEKAVRLKLRFNYKGILNVEDLWDLGLRALDSIYKELNAELKKLSEDSLLEVDQEGEVTRLKVAIVKHIFSTKQAEQKERESELEKGLKKQRLLGIIADKQDEQFRDMTVEELSTLVEEL